MAKWNMKNLLLVFILIMVLQACSERITVKRNIDGVVREDIDTAKLKKLVRSIPKPNKDEYQSHLKKGGRSITYWVSGNIEGSYRLDIKTRRFFESIDVLQKKGTILEIERTYGNIKDSGRKLTCYYYPSGILRTKVTELNIKNKITNHKAIPVRAGKEYKFNEEGKIISYVDFDRSFPFKVNSLCKVINRATDWPILEIHKMYFQENWNGNRWQDYEATFHYKMNHPYYNVIVCEGGIRVYGKSNFKSFIVDGISGMVLKVFNKEI